MQLSRLCFCSNQVAQSFFISEVLGGPICKFSVATSNTCLLCDKACDNICTKWPIFLSDHRMT